MGSVPKDAEFLLGASLLDLFSKTPQSKTAPVVDVRGKAVVLKETRKVLVAFPLAPLGGIAGIRVARGGDHERRDTLQAAFAE
jgi:hypothetical protein